MIERRSGGQIGADDIELEHVDPCVDIGVFEFLQHAVARHVHHHVDAAHGLRRLCCHSLRIVGKGGIASKGEPAAHALHQVVESIGAASRHSNRGTGLGTCQRQRFAETRRRTDDENASPGKTLVRAHDLLVTGFANARVSRYSLKPAMPISRPMPECL